MMYIVVNAEANIQYQKKLRKPSILVLRKARKLEWKELRESQQHKSLGERNRELCIFTEGVITKNFHLLPQAKNRQITNRIQATKLKILESALLLQIGT